MTNQPDNVRNLVRTSYDRIGPNYAKWAHEIRSPARQRYLDLVLDQIPTGERIVDLGCGDGTVLTAHLAERFTVTGVDISLTQLKHARRNVAAATFICADIADLELPRSSFAGISAFYCLTHLPLADLPRVMSSIARWLQPDGVFVGTFGASEEPGTIDEDWLGVPMFFSGHGPATNRRLIEDAGLIVEQESLETDDEHGVPVTFHWIVARKSSG